MLVRKHRLRWDVFIKTIYMHGLKQTWNKEQRSHKIRTFVLKSRIGKMWSTWLDWTYTSKRTEGLNDRLLNRNQALLKASEQRFQVVRCPRKDQEWKQNNCRRIREGEETGEVDNSMWLPDSRCGPHSRSCIPKVDSDVKPATFSASQPANIYCNSG